MGGDLGRWWWSEMKSAEKGLTNGDACAWRWRHWAAKGQRVTLAPGGQKDGAPPPTPPTTPALNLSHGERREVTMKERRRRNGEGREREREGRGGSGSEA